MAANPIPAPNGEVIEVNLREPWVAAILAWLIPGAGHFYQRRYAKGTIFMVCVLSTFVFGMILGEGRVVYASRARNDVRWQYIFQVGAGLPALPAVIQSYRVARGEQPFFAQSNQAARRPFRDRRPGERPFTDQEAIYAPPPGEIIQSEHDSLAEWHLRIQFFELGTLYTMIAGLLNVLAIYDAAQGPMLLPADAGQEKPPGDKDKDKSKKES